MKRGSNPIKTEKRKAWERVSKKVRERDPYCVSCLMEGLTVPSVHAGHYQYNTERNQLLGGNALWYDLRNINGQCNSCNMYKSGNLAPYARYLKEKYGHEILDELYQLWRTPRKYTLEEIEAVASS